MINLVNVKIFLEFVIVEIKKMVRGVLFFFVVKIICGFKVFNYLIKY